MYTYHKYLGGVGAGDIPSIGEGSATSTTPAPCTHCSATPALRGSASPTAAGVRAPAALLLLEALSQVSESITFNVADITASWALGEALAALLLQMLLLRMLTYADYVCWRMRT